jgi:hypothetical protein
MIQCLTGLPGFGKTATMAKWGYKAMLEGKTVYSNFPLKGAIPYNDPMEVLGLVKDALILMDEAGILLDQMKMYDMPYEVFYELRQHRKDGVDLLLSAQDLLDIAYPFRRLIQFEYRILMKIWKFAQVACLNPRTGASYNKSLWVLSNWVFKIYRSYYKVAPPNYLGISTEEKKFDTSILEKFQTPKNDEYMRDYFEYEKGRMLYANAGQNDVDSSFDVRI